MKKTKVHVRQWGDTIEYSGWQTDVPGLVCYNQDPKDSPNEKHRLSWSLVHEPTGCWIAGLYKREQCGELALRLGELGAWDGEEGFPSGKAALEVVQCYYGEL